MLLKQHMDWARHWNMLVSTLTSLHQCSQVGWAMHWIMHMNASIMDQCHNASMFTLATRCEGQGPPHFDSQPALRAPLHLVVHLGRQGMVGIQAKNYLWGEIVSFGNARSRWSCYNLLKHFLSSPPSLEAPFSRIWANHKKLFPFCWYLLFVRFCFHVLHFFHLPKLVLGSVDTEMQSTLKAVVFVACPEKNMFYSLQLVWERYFSLCSFSWEKISVCVACPEKDLSVFVACQEKDLSVCIACPQKYFLSSWSYFAVSRRTAASSICPLLIRIRASSTVA